MCRKDHPLYETWKSMRQRCNNPNHQFYPDYGKRGIKVCKEWDDFDVFCKDVGDRPAKHTLDRKKGHLGYSKDNCKWSTVTQQNCNRKCCRFIKIGDLKLALSEVARMNDIHPSTLRGRLDRGMDLDAALLVGA